MGSYQWQRNKLLASLTAYKTALDMVRRLPPAAAEARLAEKVADKEQAIELLDKDHGRCATFKEAMARTTSTK